MTIVVDEFPYLVQSDPSLPSRLQSWLDHRRPKNISLIVLGSSQQMMHGLFLDGASALYGRADRLLHLKPMSYLHFCEAIALDYKSRESFTKYSMVGGIPRYWNQLSKGDDILEDAHRLFFGDYALLSEEPDRLLRDEDIDNRTARSVLEAIGRGASRPSEIASRMGIRQSTLSKSLQILLETSLIQRSIPFGDSPRTTKKSLYKINDPLMSFWYEVFSPHRTRWSLYDMEKQQRIIEDHASKILEETWRQQFPHASRYWETNVGEFDCVRYAGDSLSAIVITEIKWKSLNLIQKQNIKEEIERKFSLTSLKKRFDLAEIEVLGFDDAMERLGLPR